jgi:hypothetical protein
MNALLSFKQLKAVAKNNRKMTKKRLRELCMSAVIEHRELFAGIPSTSSAHLLENLREFVSNLLCLDAGRKSSLHSFSAAPVKSDLVIKALSCLNAGKHRSSSLSEIAFEMWCRFICRLLDDNLTTLQQLHIRRFFTSKNETIEAMEKLMVEVGSKCRGLKLIDMHILFHDAEFRIKDDGNYMWFEPIFNRALPQLANLQVVQLLNFNCDDKALEQFSMHTKNLV